MKYTKHREAILILLRAGGAGASILEDATDKQVNFSMPYDATHSPRVVFFYYFNYMY